MKNDPPISDDSGLRSVLSHSETIFAKKIEKSIVARIYYCRPWVLSSGFTFFLSQNQIFRGGISLIFLQGEATEKVFRNSAVAFVIVGVREIYGFKTCKEKYLGESMRDQ